MDIIPVVTLNDDESATGWGRMARDADSTQSLEPAERYYTQQELAERWHVSLRSIERLQVISEGEAQAAFEIAALTDGWRRSRYADVSRVRAAVRHLVGVCCLHPEQVATTMGVFARLVCPHALIGEEAIACGIADGCSETR